MEQIFNDDGTVTEVEDSVAYTIEEYYGEYYDECNE